MNLILHPGHSKCGSTSIQKFLYDNRAILKEKGYAIPDRLFYFDFEKEADFSTEHTALKYLLNISKNQSYKTLKKRIEESLKRAQNTNVHTYIISAENLSTLPTNPLHKIFSQYFNMTNVVYYIRRQDDFTLSAWQQWGYKTGKNLEEYCAFQLRGGRPLYSQIITMLTTNYKKEIVVVVPFSRKVFLNGDLILDFLERTGLDFLAPTAINFRVENKSLNPIVCDYLSRYPDIYRTKHDNRHKTSLEKHKKTKPWLFDSRKNYLSVKQREVILAHFEPENRILHKTHFPNIDFDSIFGLEKNESLEQTKSLGKEQEEFLESWVTNWSKKEKLRAFIHSVMGNRFVSPV